MWLLDRNLWYMLKYYRSGCQWSFFFFLVKWNLEDNMLDTSRQYWWQHNWCGEKKAFCCWCKTNKQQIYMSVFTNLYLFFVYCFFFLLISNNHNFQWILQNIDLGLWINDIFERRVPFCGAYGSWWQIMAGQFCRQSTHRRLLKLQIQIQKINKEKYKVQSYDMAISKGWRNIWSINGLELKYAFAMTLWPFTRFFLYNCEGENY